MESALNPVLDHADFLARHCAGWEDQYVLTGVLLEIGVPGNCVGFDYLKFAIVKMMSDPTQTLDEVYLQVREKYSLSSGRKPVEQAIHDVIVKAWASRDDAVWECYFLQRNAWAKNVPSNGDFIYGLVRFMDLWKGGCKKEVCHGTK